jgi:ComF family protein
MNKHEVMQHIQQTTVWALDLVFPPRCAVCQRGSAILCRTCLAQLQPARPPRCPHCYGALNADGTCSACRYHPLQLSGLRAFGQYAGPLRACIHALKYAGVTRLAQPLGQLLARTYYTHHLQTDLLVPVPLHSERQRQRGYNHASLLAAACSRVIGIPVNEELVARQRATMAQVGLELQERRQNVEGAFRCTPSSLNGQLAGRRVLLIDDVCTTGATLEACAAPLFAAGARSVWGLVLARTQT